MNLKESKSKTSTLRKNWATKKIVLSPTPVSLIMIILLNMRMIRKRKNLPLRYRLPLSQKEKVSYLMVMANKISGNQNLQTKVNIKIKLKTQMGPILRVSFKLRKVPFQLMAIWSDFSKFQIQIVIKAKRKWSKLKIRSKVRAW